MPQAAPKRTRCCSVRLGRVRTSSSVRWPAAYLQAVDCRVGWNSRAGLTSVMVLSVKHNMHSCAMEGAALVHGGSRPACGAHHLAAVAWPVPQISMNVDMTWRKGRGAGGDEEHWSSCHVRQVTDWAAWCLTLTQINQTLRSPPSTCSCSSASAAATRDEVPFSTISLTCGQRGIVYSRQHLQQGNHVQRTTMRHQTKHSSTLAQGVDNKAAHRSPAHCMCGWWSSHLLCRRSSGPA